MVDKDGWKVRSVAEHKAWSPELIHDAQFREWVSQVILHKIKLEHEAKEPRAIFDAIFICADYGIVMPSWVVDAFKDAYFKVTWYEVASWDEAFGRPNRINFNLESARFRQASCHQVCAAIAKASIEEHAAIDSELFGKVGKSMGIGLRQVRDMWLSSVGFRKSLREYKRRLKGRSPKTIPLIRKTQDL